MQVQSVYEDTVDLLKHLDENQLMAIHSVIVELTTAQEKWHSPLEIHSDEEMWDHIDLSLKQARAGEGRDADEVIDDLMREYAN